MPIDDVKILKLRFSANLVFRVFLLFAESVHPETSLSYKFSKVALYNFRGRCYNFTQKIKTNISFQ